MKKYDKKIKTKGLVNYRYENQKLKKELDDYKNIIKGSKAIIKDLKQKLKEQNHDKKEW